MNRPHPIPLYLVRAYGWSMLTGAPQPLNRFWRGLLTLDNRSHLKRGRGSALCGLLSKRLGQS